MVTGADVERPYTLSYSTKKVRCEFRISRPCKKEYPQINNKIEAITSTAVLISLVIFKIEGFL